MAIRDRKEELWDPAKRVKTLSLRDMMNDERMQDAVMMALPAGRIEAAAKVPLEAAARYGRKLAPAARSYFFRALEKKAPGAFAKMSETYPIAKFSQLRSSAGLIRKSYAEHGILPAVGRTIWEAGKISQRVGHNIVSVVAKDAGATSSSPWLAKRLRNAADFMASPLGLYMEYRYATKKADEEKSDADKVSANADRGETIRKTETLSSDVAEALAERSDPRVLADALSRRVSAYDEARKTRFDRAAAAANRDRKKGDFDKDAAIARASDALVKIDEEDLAALTNGIDRTSEAWSDLRRQRIASAMMEDSFVKTYGVDYDTLGSMMGSKDKASVDRANAIIDEFKATLPTGGVDEIRFMAGKEK